MQNQSVVLSRVSWESKASYNKKVFASLFQRTSNSILWLKSHLHASDEQLRENKFFKGTDSPKMSEYGHQLIENLCSCLLFTCL